MIRYDGDRKRKRVVEGEPMNEIAELERRIAYAMERIAKGVEALDRVAAPVTPDPVMEVPAPEPALAPKAVDNSTEIAALRAELEEERLANAQLEERVRVLKRRQEVQAANLQTEQATTREKLSQLDQELTRLRRANDQLQVSNDALRTANESGLSEPHLMNTSMMSELEAMRAARQADRAEAEAIKVALMPLLSDASRAEDDAAADQGETGKDDATDPEGKV